MSPIHFCQHTRDRFARDIKLAKREIKRETSKKAKDKVKHAERVAEEVKDLTV